MEDIFYGAEVQKEWKKQAIINQIDILAYKYIIKEINIASPCRPPISKYEGKKN